MRKNRCFKLIALVLTLSLVFAVMLSATTAMGEDTYQTGILLEETLLNDTFVQSATVTDNKGNQITDIAAADPNNTLTLQLVVSEPADAETAEQQLPEDTNEVSVIYELDGNLKAVNGGNDVVSWTYDEEDKVLEFNWVNGKPSSFTANIEVVPNAPASNDLSGSYVLVTKTNVMVGYEGYSDNGRNKLKSYKVNIENGMVRPESTENPVWVLKHVSGNYYTVYSQNAGAYLELVLPNHAKLNSDEASAQKILIENNNGGYTFRFNGKGLNNSGNNPATGFACYNAGTASNEVFTLYPVSSVINNPTKDLSGTWAITNAQRKRLLSSESSGDGKLKAAAYTNVDGTFIPFVDQIAYWTFEHVVRDWYTVHTDGGYLNISSSGISVTNTPQKLQAQSDDGFNTFTLKNSEGYGVRSADDNNFNASKNGIGDNLMRITLKSTSGISHEDADISGNWAITTSSAQAALQSKAIDANRLSSIQYSKTNDGSVFSIAENIDKWTFTRKNGNWYTIQAQDGRYLSIAKDKAALTNSESLVYIQKKDGKIRITDGDRYALSNVGTSAGYNGKMQATASKEWHSLAAVMDVNTVLTFDINGGTANDVPNAILGEAGDTITLPALEGNKNGQEFIGWATVKDIFAKNPGTNHSYHDIYKPNTQYKLKEGKDTLYAVYNAANRTVQFGIREDGIIQDEPNNYDQNKYKGHFSVDGILKEGHWVVDIDSSKPVNGYYVNNNVIANLNWVPSAEQIQKALWDEGRIQFDPETQYIHYYVMKVTGDAGNHTWKVDGVIRNKANVEITYNSNVPGTERTEVGELPGSCSVAPGTEVLIGLSKDGKTILTPTRKGYVFMGWNTEPDGSGKSYSAGHYVKLKSNLNLYAQWKQGFAITITSDWPEGKPAPSGTMIELTAHPSGFDGLVEGVDYILQWRYSTDLQNWIDEPGANEITFTYELNTTTAQYTWKVVAVEPPEK